MILLDTDVLSEALKPSPSAAVIAWLNVRFSECAISSITIFELGAGLALLPKGRRRAALEVAVARTVRRFGPRVYSFDTPAARAAVVILERARAKGSGLHRVQDKLADLQLAGIASAYGLEFATRNLADFKNTGLSIINPWEES